MTLQKKVEKVLRLGIDEFGVYFNDTIPSLAIHGIFDKKAEELSQKICKLIEEEKETYTIPTIDDWASGKFSQKEKQQHDAIKLIEKWENDPSNYDEKVLPKILDGLKAKPLQPLDEREVILYFIENFVPIPDREFAKEVANKDSGVNPFNLPFDLIRPLAKAICKRFGSKKPDYVCEGTPYFDSLWGLLKKDTDSCKIWYLNDILASLYGKDLRIEVYEI